MYLSWTYFCLFINFRVVVITSGISSFIFLKRYVDKRRLELIKAKGRERMLEAQKDSNNKTWTFTTFHFHHQGSKSSLQSCEWSWREIKILNKGDIDGQFYQQCNILMKQETCQICMSPSLGMTSDCSLTLDIKMIVSAKSNMLLKSKIPVR